VGIKPTVAVFALAPEHGVAEGIARLLSEQLTQKVRQSAAFARVVSAQEVEALLGFERQKQMMNCDAAGCMAEIAGSLGVDFLMVGSVGKIGESFLINVKLLNVKLGLPAASVSERMRGTSEEALLDSVAPCVRALLGEAHLAHALKDDPADPPASPDSLARPVVLLGAAISGLAGGALLPAGAAMAAAALAVLIVPANVFVPQPSFVAHEHRDSYFRTVATALALVTMSFGLAALGLIGVAAGSATWALVTQ